MYELKLLKTYKCKAPLRLEDSTVGHEANIEMNNKSHSCVCMICPGGSLERRMALAQNSQCALDHSPAQTLDPRRQRLSHGGKEALFWPLSLDL